MVIETDDMGNEVLATKEGMRNRSKLSLATWLIGWDRLALALAMLKMLNYGIAMKYKQVLIAFSLFAGLVFSGCTIIAGDRRDCDGCIC